MTYLQRFQLASAIASVLALMLAWLTRHWPWWLRAAATLGFAVGWLAMCTVFWP
jgi:hypothetical protein